MKSKLGINIEGMSIETSEAAVLEFRLQLNVYRKHARSKEVVSLMQSNVGRFVQFKSKGGSGSITAKIHSINRTAFVSGCRLAYMRRGKREMGGIVSRYVVDITKCNDSDFRSMYGTSNQFLDIVKHVLFLESVGINVPKLNQPRSSQPIEGESSIIEDSANNNIRETPAEVTTEEIAELTQEVAQGVIVSTVPVSRSTFLGGSEFNSIRETVNAMYLADLLNDRIRAEINSIILEKLFNTDFVEEILNNNF